MTFNLLNCSIVTRLSIFLISFLLVPGLLGLSRAELSRGLGLLTKNRRRRKKKKFWAAIEEKSPMMIARPVSSFKLSTHARRLSTTSLFLSRSLTPAMESMIFYEWTFHLNNFFSFIYILYNRNKFLFFGHFSHSPRLGAKLRPCFSPGC